MSGSDVEEATDRVRKAGRGLRGRSRAQSAIETLRTRAVQMVVVVAVIAALSWAYGSLITPQTGIFLFVLLVLGSLVTDRVGTFSFPFALTAVAILGLVFHFVLPAGVAAAFAPLTELVQRATGLDATQIDAWRFALYSVAAVIVAWIVDIRVTSAFRRKSGQPEAANADTVARALARRVENLFEDYVEIGVALLGLALTLLLVLLSGVGDLGAQVLEAAAQVPVLAAALLNWFTGYVALGGEVPVLEDVPVVGTVIEAMAGMGPVGFGILAAVVILLAWFAREARDS